MSGEIVGTHLQKSRGLKLVCMVDLPCKNGLFDPNVLGIFNPLTGGKLEKARTQFLLGNLSLYVEKKDELCAYVIPCRVYSIMMSLLGSCPTFVD